MEMGEVEKRIFIGNLFQDISQKELEEKFSRFGVVKNVEIKTRKNDVDADFKTFAYLNLRADENSFKKCFTAYNNTLWKGKRLKLQYAKEDFLSRLEQERKELAVLKSRKNGSSPCKQELPPSPAFVNQNKKAVPGTPVDKDGKWVVGKYGRVLPVLHIKNPKSGKIITLDPSKTTHALQKIKEYASEDNSMNANSSELTWQIDVIDSEITKKRKGEFTHWEPPKKLRPGYSTANCKANAVGESSAKEEFEVVSSRATSRREPNWNLRHFSDGNDSAGSADTDEIISQSSQQAKGNQTSSRAANQAFVRKDIRERSGKKRAENSGSPIICDSDVQTEKLSSGMAAPRFVKGAKSHGKTVATRAALSKKTIGPLLSKAGNRIEPAKHIQQSADKNKPKEMLGGKQKAFVAQHPVRIPEFRGLAMLSTDEETDDENKGLSKSTEDGDTSSERSSFHSLAPATPENLHDQLSCTKNTSPSVSVSSSIANRVKSRGDLGGLAQTELGSVKQVQASTGKPAKFLRVQGRALKADFLWPSFFSSPQTETAMSQARTANAETSCKPPLSTNNTFFSDASDGDDTDDILSTSASSERRFTNNTSKQKAIGKDQGFVNEYDDGFSNEMRTGNYEQTDSSHHHSDDSDLDSNDFEVVAKKMADIFKRQQESAGLSSRKSKQCPRAILPKKAKEELRSILKKASPEFVMSAQETPLRLSVRHVTKAEAPVEDHQGRPPKGGEDNQRRLEAIHRRMLEKNKQQNIIRQALQSENTPASKKTFLDSDEDSVAAASSLLQKNCLEEKQFLQLFSSSDDEKSEEDADYTFRIRTHYEGDRGNKLMALQSGFGTDSRFRMNEHFLDDSDGSDANDKDDEPGEIKEETELLAEEKATSFRILEQVVGHKVNRRNPKKKTFVDMNMVRYVPGTERSKHLEVKDVNKDQPELKKKKSTDKGKLSSVVEKEQSAQNEGNEPEIPENKVISHREKFYEVASNLKELFTESPSNTFTFLSKGEPEEKSASFKLRQMWEEPASYKPLDKKTLPKTDDSHVQDSEDETSSAGRDLRTTDISDDSSGDSVDEACHTDAGTRLAALSQTSCAQNTFFFDFNDPRLEAGVKFFQRPENFDEIMDRWSEQRSHLIELYKQRHKRFLRKASREKRLARRKVKR